MKKNFFFIALLASVLTSCISSNEPALPMRVISTTCPPDITESIVGYDFELRQDIPLFWQDDQPLRLGSYGDSNLEIGKQIDCIKKGTFVHILRISMLYDSLKVMGIVDSPICYEQEIDLTPLMNQKALAQQNIDIDDRFLKFYER